MSFFKSLPEEIQRHPQVRNLAIHAGFIRTAQGTPPVEQLERAIAANPDDLETRYRLSGKNDAR